MSVLCNGCSFVERSCVCSNAPGVRSKELANKKTGKGPARLSFFSLRDSITDLFKARRDARDSGDITITVMEDGDMLDFQMCPKDALRFAEILQKVARNMIDDEDEEEEDSVLEDDDESDAPELDSYYHEHMQDEDDEDAVIQPETKYGSDWATTVELPGSGWMKLIQHKHNSKKPQEIYFDVQMLGQLRRMLAETDPADRGPSIRNYPAVTARSVHKNIIEVDCNSMEAGNKRFEVTDRSYGFYIGISPLLKDGVSVAIGRWGDKELVTDCYKIGMNRTCLEGLYIWLTALFIQNGWGIPSTSIAPYDDIAEEKEDDGESAYEKRQLAENFMRVGTNILDIAVKGYVSSAPCDKMDRLYDMGVQLLVANMPTVITKNPPPSFIRDDVVEHTTFRDADFIPEDEEDKEPTKPSKKKMPAKEKKQGTKGMKPTTANIAKALGEDKKKPIPKRRSRLSQYTPANDEE